MVKIVTILFFAISTACSINLRVKYDYSIDEISLRRYSQNSDIQLIVRASNSIESSLMKIGTVISDDTFIIKARVSDIPQLRNNIDVIGQYKPQHKFIKNHFESIEDVSITSVINAKKESTEWRQTFSDSQGQERVLIQVHLEPYADAMKVMNELSSLPFLERILVSTKKLVLSLSATHASTIIEQYIAPITDIHWIEPRATHEISNFWAKKIISSHDKVEDQFSYFLTGAGQIIGIADSGLDYNNCFFYDPNHPIPIIVNDTLDNRTNNHRKISAYWRFIDDKFDNDDHGTHVSGSVAGSASNSMLSSYNGLAKDSSIVFTDIGCADPQGCTCNGASCLCNMIGGCKPNSRQVFLPLDLNTGLFPFSYDRGARIHTNSWGGGPGLGYNLDATEIDTFAWEHQDFLIIFAAGNSGDIWEYFSISSAAEAKNALTVGASMSDLESFIKIAYELDDYSLRTKTMAASIMKSINCDSIKVCDSVKPEISSICEFLARNFTTEMDCCSTVGFCSTQYSKSSDSSCGCALKGAGYFCCRECRMQRHYNESSQNVRDSYNRENLAYFSSRGPTIDGRIKPDVVAPGHYVVSARSHSNTVTSGKQCATSSSKNISDNVVQKAGTSMATPLVAGAAALIRQYFVEGYYINGERNVINGFSPSSALMKAVLINSGTSLLGTVINRQFSIPIHEKNSSASYYFNAPFLEGFGRITLNKVLLFDSQNAQKLLVGRSSNVDNNGNIIASSHFGDPIMQHGHVHMYCMFADASNNNEVKFTLVWTDIPSTPARQRHLINNIDLIVYSVTDGDVYYGNGGGRNIIFRDNLNNVEQITIKQGTKFVAIVEGTTISHYATQPYALVITGLNATFRKCDNIDRMVMGMISAPSLFGVPYIYLFSGTLALSAVLLVIIVILLVVLIRTHKKEKLLEVRGVELKDEDVQ